jgi:hypothetical protein
LSPFLAQNAISYPGRFENQATVANISRNPPEKAGSGESGSEKIKTILVSISHTIEGK